MEVQDFIHKVEKEFGKDIIIPMDYEETFDVISSGSFSLDLATGVGGIPTKKITEIYGAEGSGKSTLSLEIAKNFLLNFDRNVLYVDVENMLHPDYVKQILGFDPKERFILSQPLTSEDALMIIEEAIKSGIFGVVILDSVGALSPKKEVESELDKDSYAGSAKLISKFTRRIVPFVRVSNVAFIVVNQVRDKIGAYTSSYDTPGGHTLKHFYSLRIMLSASTKIQDKGDIVGNYVKFILKKNKVGNPFTSGEFPLIFGKGIDTITDVINVATKLGIIVRRGSYYYFEGEQVGQGTASVRKMLEDSPETLDRIKEMCYTLVYPKEKEVVEE